MAEADSRTTRGLIGNADSRTTAGLIGGLPSPPPRIGSLSWFTLNSEYDVEREFTMSRHITEPLVKEFTMSRNILNALTREFTMIRNIWGFLVFEFTMSRSILNNLAKEFTMSRAIYDSLSGKIRVTFKAAKSIREYFGYGDVKGDKKKSRMR